MSNELSREELTASLAARRELGQEYETALVDSLAERIEQVVTARVEARVAEQRPAPVPASVLSPRERIALGLGSLIFAIPCSAIAGDVAGATGLVVVWAGIAIVNVAAAITPGRGR